MYDHTETPKMTMDNGLKEQVSELLRSEAWTMQQDSSPEKKLPNLPGWRDCRETKDWAVAQYTFRTADVDQDGTSITFKDFAKINNIQRPHCFL